MRLPVLFLFATLAFAAVDGTVVNRTSGEPEANATVTLYRLDQTGMQPVKTVRAAADGKFHFDAKVEGPHLLQAIHGGVAYNHMLSPGNPVTGIELAVFDSSSKPGIAPVAQHMVLLEPAERRLAVSETFFLRNQGNLTYNNPEQGTLRIYLPEEAVESARVMVTAPNSMPVERPSQKTNTSGIYLIDFPIKPGETRFDLTYQLPFSGTGKFSGKVLEKEGTARLVVPSGVTVQGKGLEMLGIEPSTQAQIYGLKTGPYAVEITGTGALRATDRGEDEAPGIQQILPRIYDRLYWVLGLSLAILGIGFYLLYRSPNKEIQASAPPARTGRKAK